jgi:hypothetical protein
MPHRRLRWLFSFMMVFGSCLYGLGSTQEVKTDCVDQGEPAFEIQISTSRPITFDEWFTITFSIQNIGTTGAYFKIPWKWTTNGMFLRATDEKGRFYDTVSNFHPHSNSNCPHFKAIDSGDRYIFEIGFLPPGKFEVTAGELRFPGPGKYRLKWIYNPEHLESDDTCASGGWPIWKKPLESPEIEVNVLPKKSAPKGKKE